MTDDGSISVGGAKVCRDKLSAIAGTEANDHSLDLASVEAEHLADAAVRDADAVVRRDRYAVEGGRYIGGERHGGTPFSAADGTAWDCPGHPWRSGALASG
jgi:hypothetical protein